MNFRSICLMFLLFVVAKAINPFEGNLPRFKCLKGRFLEGCNSTLLEAYKKTDLPRWQKPDENVNEADTYFMLFTRRNKDNPEYLDSCGGLLPRNTYFNSQKSVIIIIHGVAESTCQVAWQREMKTQLLFKDDYNVILVDYGWGNQLDYYDSIRNGIVVAKQMAFVIITVMNQTGIAAVRFHIIGHSLGAQIGGLNGHYVFLLTGQKLRRITGLDPAGPGYIGVPLDERLDKSDALHVDVIHTNAGECLPFFGYPRPIGHADFYVNGGSVQISCVPYIVISFLKGDISYGTFSLLLTICFHKQSVQYFKVSINPCKCEFIAVACKSWEDFHSGKCRSCGTDGSDCEVMGMNWELYIRKNESRSLFLKTATHCPYCDNKDIDTQGFPSSPTSGTANNTKCFENSLL